MSLAAILLIACDDPGSSGVPEPVAVAKVPASPTTPPDVRATVVAEITATAIAQPTETPTPTRTRTPTVTPTASPTATPTPDVRATALAEVTATAIAQPTETPTLEPTATPTVTATPTPTATHTATPTPTYTPTPLPTLTATTTPLPTATPTPTERQTPIPTDTLTHTATPTPVPTNTPTPTEMPTPVPTNTPTPTEIPTPVPTNTPTPTEIPTPVPTNTPTPTETPTPPPTETPAPTFTPTPTSTPTLADVVSNIEPGVVRILTSTGTGSGFIVDEDGLVVTNAHVVGSFRSVNVRLASGKEYVGDVVSLDKASDLAIIDLSTSDRFAPVPVGDSDLVSVGDNVIAVGYPIGSVLGGSPTITRGIVSSKRRYSAVDYLQTDAAINPGNSGGPLVNRSGQVIGVNTSKIERAGGRPIEGVGLAIAVNEVSAMLPLLPLAVSQDVPPHPATPLATQIPDSSETYQNGRYGYSIRIAPGWTLDEVAETDDRASFWAPSDVGLFQINVYDLAEFPSLRKFAEWRRDEIEGSHIERKQERGREFYWLVSSRLRAGGGCSAFYIELITFSSWYPDKPYGFILSSAVCEHSIDAYDQDRLDMLDSFSEWEHYRNSTYGYHMNIAPGWTLSEEEKDGYASLWAPGHRSFLEITAHDLGGFSSFPAFAEWRRTSLRKGGESWPVFEITSSGKSQEEGRDFYWLDYRKQESTEVCVSRNAELIGRSSQYPEVPYGFIVHSGVCEYSYEIYGQDVIVMLESFKY